MLKYDTQALLKNKNTYYELVISVAKRARTLVEQAEAEHDILEDKPVRMAIDELQSGKYVIRHEAPGHVDAPPAPAPASFSGHLSNESLTEQEKPARDEDDEDEPEDEDSFDAAPDNRDEDDEDVVSDDEETEE